MANRNLPSLSSGDSSFDKIWAHYKSPAKFPLTANQERLKKRWLAAWTSLLDKNSKTQTVAILEEAFGISRAQAFRDIRNAERLFGRVMRADREGQNALLYEYALEGYKKALDKKDLKIARAFLAEMRACIPHEDPIHFNPEKLENKPIKMSVPKEVSNAILKSLSGGMVDFNNLEVEDVEHEEVEDEGED